MADEAEQALCLQCGMCCDGTMFDIAWLTDEEALSLAELFGVERADKRARFRQPCPHSRDCVCQVYASRPQACRKYRCKLLKDLSAGVIEPESARARIAEAKRALGELQPFLAHGETPWSARRRRAAMLAEKRPMTPEEGAFVLRTAALDLLLERHFRTDDSRLFASDER